MKKLVANRQSKAQVNRILDQYAQFVEKDLSLPSTLLKMGPMLGLMGTLIRRIKPVIEQNSNLLIESERGKSYRLIIR